MTYSSLSTVTMNDMVQVMMYRSLSTVTVNDVVQEDYDVQFSKYCYCE